MSFRLDHKNVVSSCQSKGSMVALDEAVVMVTSSAISRASRKMQVFVNQLFSTG